MSEQDKKKVLVTGATGFVGTWLTKRLINDGHEVHILTRPDSDVSELEGLKFVHHLGDITQLRDLIEAFEGMDAVFHLAGLIGYSKAMRSKMEKINVDGTANVIRACKVNEVKRLIYMSSVVAIGASFDGKHPLNESSAYNVSQLNLGYFETKLAAEALVRRAVANKEIDAVILNPSTIYGAGDAKKGSRKVQLKVARGKFPFYTSGGVNVVAIEDVISALVAAWKNGRTGERYILAGENITIKQLFKIIAEEAGVKPPKYYLPNPVVKTIGRMGDHLESTGRKGPLNSENAWTSILFHWFDCSKAKKELNFKPRPAREAIRSSIQWSQKNGILP